jgi:hypothetical protein
LFRTRLLQGRYDQAGTLARQLSELSEASPDRDDLRVGAARALGSVHFYVGHDQATTLEHLAPAFAAADADRPGQYLGRLTDVIDPVITSRAYAAWATWLTGDTKEARRLSDEAVTAARRLAHPFTLCLALSFDSWLCQFEGDVDAALSRAEEGLARSLEHGFVFWVGWARVLIAWAASKRGALDQVSEMRLGVEQWQVQGSQLGKTYFVGLIASVLLDAHEYDQCLTVVDEALDLVAELGEHFWESELLRLKAEALSGLGAPTATVHEVLDAAESLARSQGAWALHRRIEATRSAIA